MHTVRQLPAMRGTDCMMPTKEWYWLEKLTGIDLEWRKKKQKDE